MITRTTSRVKKDLLLISATTTPTVSDHHTNLNNKLVEERIKNPNKNYKVLLSFDGGGIKAILETGERVRIYWFTIGKACQQKVGWIFLLQILKAIEDELDEPLLNRIHWMGGTSCGGIISVSLGTGLSIEQCRRIFLSARYQTFCGNTMMFPKHNCRGIEDVLRQSLGTRTTMMDLKKQKVLVTAAKIKSAPPQLVLFRSYAPRITPREFERYGYMNPEKILLWKVARATS
ncbi:phospholipase, patatin family [Necator americanus]|uniref:Phospholipase, patatin family n=1 Tax=Necator americanus TaxID=51031 RepID=W2SPB5_NECAM|nr:phospholipase, patatin family [Necator americanus]ETN70542.1 phospholipase, patatin family [Necator americanus]